MVREHRRGTVVGSPKVSDSRYTGPSIYLGGHAGATKALVESRLHSRSLTNDLSQYVLLCKMQDTKVSEQQARTHDAR